MRYLPNSPADRKAMLEATGHAKIEELFEQIPAELRLNCKLNLPGPLSESEILDFFRQVAAESSRDYVSLLGAGAYAHYSPVAADALVSRGEFFTAYTPYQAEIAQGTLQAMFEFQTLMTQLTGQEVSNASLWDGSTATTEAILMAERVTGRHRIIMAKTLHPEYREIAKTYTQNQADVELVEVGYDSTGQIDVAALASALNQQTAAVAIQSPNFFGVIEKTKEIAEIAHKHGALLIVSINEPLSLAVVRPPVEADIVCGEAQSFGVSVSFGGPYVGFLTTREKYIRQMPGRLVGQTVDTEGRRGFVLTLATREQHIRREKATSNICTNQSLFALVATIYLTLLGKNGLRQLAEQNLSKAHYAAAQLRGIEGFSLPFAGPHFNEFVVKVPGGADALLEELRRDNIVGGVNISKDYSDAGNLLLVCFTELVSRASIDRFVEGCKRFAAKSQPVAASVKK
jgi:glycine dehydrogenase subunit 1